MSASKAFDKVIEELKDAQHWAARHPLAKTVARCVLMLDHVAPGKMFNHPDGPTCWDAI
tara:strand:- start:248 stop:424 length:177 start_codon:yes stop_codon:yes gene_type:complete